MAASSLFFGGRLISVPGSYSIVDATGLEQVGLGAAGIVAILGTAEGGIPVDDITSVDDFIRLNKPSAVRETFRSGDLREAAAIAFEPAKDADILGGAVEVVAMKVNPATQSTATFGNAQGDALIVTSEDYGAFTEQINVDIQSGTNKGKFITVTFEDTVQAQDDVGGDALFKIKYDGSDADAWDTMVAAVETGGKVATDATRDTTGLDGDVTNPVAAAIVEILSSDSGDTNQVVLYGLDGTGNAVSETLTLAGTGVVDGSQVWGAGDLFGVRVIGTNAGTITVRNDGGGTTIFTVAPGTDAVEGMVHGKVMYVANKVVTLVADAASTADVLVVGKGTTGATQVEKITLSGTTPVPGVALFTEITGLVLGDVAAARTVTTSARAGETTSATQDTLQKVADYYNGRFITGTGGFVFTIETGRTTYDVTLFDVSVSTTNCFDPAEPSYYADLNAIVEYLNQSNDLVDAAAASGATGGAPDNTTSPVFLAGGSEGTTTSTQWQTALNLLKQVRVNSVVVVTGDPAIHAALDAHCAYMGGIGRSERDGFVGILDTATTAVVPPKADIKAQIVDLNSRHIRAWAQSFERFNTNLERTTFLPQFGGALLAGMQAGSSVGTSLTFKFMNVLSLSQDSTWNPTDDAEEMIQAGLCFAENIDGVGRRVVRNITTHLTTSNLAFTEGSVNEATNFSVFSFRSNMEFAVGKKGFAGTVNAGKGVAIGTLGLLVDEEILVAYRALFIELIADVMEVSCEIAPVIPINFVKNTLHLVTIRQTAA